MAARQSHRVTININHDFNHFIRKEVNAKMGTDATRKWDNIKDREECPNKDSVVYRRFLTSEVFKGVTYTIIQAIDKYSKIGVVN